MNQPEPAPLRPLAETLIGVLGIEMLEQSPERMVGRMPIDNRTIQPAGIVHAGALASLADTLASIGTMLGLDPRTQFCVGQELSISLLRPVAEGKSVDGEAVLLHRGRTSAVWDVRMRTPEGKLAAISRCTVAIRARE
ncbi:MAG TPA: PaaI family thioesterase [Chloroflexota bacterium]|jgi:1,4-dihydroxy-2-naphthoyl-CoA hydrolase|nr:PaaI family thioesterase [Chloroflexota bacterium]